MTTRYDYEGGLVPNWPNGVGQIPAIVGSVSRTLSIANGICNGG